MKTPITNLGKGQLTPARLEDRSGLALVATILVLALIAVLTTVALSGAMSALSTAGSDYQDMRVFYAAEAGGEGTLAQLKIALSDGYLSDNELTNIKPPILEAISFDSFAVKKMGEATVETVTDGPYAGLYALTQNVDIYSRAENSRGDIAAIILRTKAQAIPIFQFGVFFQQDLEATNGPPMEFLGRVHSNGNIYLSSNNAWYRDLITTPNKIFHDRKDFHLVYDGVYVNDASGNEVPLDFDSRTHASPEAFKAESCAKFDCRVMTDAFDVDSLSLPLPDGVPPYELILPRQSDDGDAERNVKFAWNADMYVTVDLRDIRPAETVCGGSTPPDKADGDVTITALDPVYPGQAVRFVASHPLLDCGEFDSRAVLRVESDMLSYTTGMTNCNFIVNIPAGDLSTLTIEITLDRNLYAQLVSSDKGKAQWKLQDLVNKEATWPYITVERTGGREVPSAADMCKIFQWEWSDFYDGRDKELRDALNIDINELSTWVSGNSARTAEVIYVDFKLPADISGYSKKLSSLILDATIDPATRLLGGVELPNRLTVASEWPFYTLGNYNTTNKKPAALVGDGLTILSEQWNDGDNTPLDVFDSDGDGNVNEILQECPGDVMVGKPCSEFLAFASSFWVKKNAAETTVNAAILAGHTATPCDHEDSSCIADGTSSYYEDWYGGGLENFPRFLEHWYDVYGNRQTLHYTGALVSPFTSQKTTGTWNGTYYSPPQRDWRFDTDFQDPRLLPPGTPNVGYVIRTAMREAY